MIRHRLLDLTPTGSPFHTLRGLYFNIRTLGLGWWLYCLARNAQAAIARRLRSESGWHPTGCETEGGSLPSRARVVSGPELGR